MIELKKKRKTEGRNQKKSIFLRILFYLFLLAFLGTVFYILFFSPFIKISSIEIIGNEYIEQELIAEEINPEISGKYFNYVDKNNLLLFRAGKIKKEILERFKVIKEIEIKRKFPHSLKINILERKPQMIICSQNECFILDENGEAYENIDPSSEEAQKNNFPILIDESGKDINFSDIVLDKPFMNYFLGAKEKIPEMFDLEIERDARTPSLISGDIKMKTKEGWGIYLNKKIELERELEMLRAVLENKITNEQRRELEYIDLRIGNKIYYKFKEEIQEEAEKNKKAD